MATRKQLDDAVAALPAAQKAAVKRVIKQAESTGKGVSANEITYIFNNLSSIGADTNAKAFLGSAKSRTEANKAGTPATGTTPTPAPASVDPYSKYETTIALVKSDPELDGLFQRAVSEGWMPEKFQAAFRDTKWYTDNGMSWRGAETARLTDPGQYEVALSDATDKVRSELNRLGFSLTDVQIADLAKQTLYSSWGKGIDVAKLGRQVVEMGRLTGSGGEALDTIDKLKKSAYDNGQNYDNAWYEAAARGVLGEGKDINTYEKMIQENAKGLYASLAPQLDSGMTVRQAAAGYIATMSQRLGIDETAVDLNDPLLSRALKGIDEAGKPTAMPLYEFEKTVKRDERYFKTNEAKQNALDMASEIARAFGKAY